MIVLALVFGFLITRASLMTQAEETPERLENLKGQRETLQNNIADLEEKINQYQNELSDKRTEINSLKNELSRINTQLNKLNLEIKRTENQIYITRLNIQETQAGITETAADIDKKLATLASLIRELDKIERESFLERLLIYNDLSDVLSQMEYLGSVQKKLNQVVGETKILKSSLENKEVALTNSKKELEQKNTQLAVQKSAQQSEKNRKNSVLKETRGEEAKYQQLLSQAEEEQAAFLKELAKIEETILIEKNFIDYFQAGTIPPRGTKLFIWPEDKARLSQGYGGKGHNGIDMVAGLGSPIKAAASGTVVAKSADVCRNYVNPSCNGYWGNWIALQHTGGLVTLYSHLSRPTELSVGETVETGEVIGYEGATGNITGAHLHFSVFTEFFTFKDPKTGDIRISYNYDKTLNPLDYL